MTNAPGPKGLPLIGHYFDVCGDILSQMLQWRAEYGDIVRLRLGPSIYHIISHPDHVRQILLTKRKYYPKTGRSTEQVRYLAGQSLLVSEGEDWQKKRRLLQPSFRDHSVAEYAELMHKLTWDMMVNWQDQMVIDIAQEMTRLTYRIVGLSLMSDDLQTSGDQMARSMALTLQHLYHRIYNIPFPLWIPTPGNLIFRRERTSLRKIVSGMMLRRHKVVRNDLLNKMIQANKSEKDACLDDIWLRDEMVTLLLAGHETTANALTFCCHLLATHPEQQDQVFAEIHRVIGDRPVQYSDLKALMFTQQVFQESMRLYPPIWAIERRVGQDDRIAGFDLPTGSTVLISIWAMHRHPEFWPDPEAFQPERFSPGKSVEQAYLPFGLGPRICIGINFAQQEAMVILAAILQQYRLLSVTTEITPKPGITLRVHGPLPLKLERRQ